MQYSFTAWVLVDTLETMLNFLIIPFVKNKYNNHLGAGERENMLTVQAWEPDPILSLR